MSRDGIKGYIDELDGRQKNPRFNRLVTICTKVFGEPAKSRGRGSHLKFKTPWKGNPRINLQKLKGGKSKGYQVDQVLQALRRLFDTLDDTTSTNETD